ncbi:hypothetical protein GJAV_G00261560 [Gymnothorax javanicus]|nr:hypothetical protein GJAV_G00261560 [Gymnothorax javanicus]
MSKVERLNARVAKLLTVAVHEVLEVVRETVSEYQEKTARTQRENESLRRRLQELQDKVNRTSTGSLPAGLSATKEKSVREQEWSSHMTENTELTPTDEKREVVEERKIGQREDEDGILESDHMAESEIDCDVLVSKLRIMSKIERLNARVAKLLTVAVHEVLEVVRETVTEYQEKTARTQRENESLKRRLQELKDKEERRNTVQEQLAIPPVTEGVPIERKREWNPSLKDDTQPVFTKRKEVTEQLKMRQGEEEGSVLKSDLITEPPFDCDAMVTGHGTVECVDFSPRADAVLSEFTSHPVISSTDFDSAHAVNISSSPCTNTSSFGILSNSDEIKSEPDSVEYTSSQHAGQNDYYVCPDTGNNMAHSDAVPELEQVGRGSDELACFQSNHNPFVDRFAFAKK